MGEKFEECITKLASKCEKLQDFDGALDYYKIINSEDDIINKEPDININNTNTNETLKRNVSSKGS